MKKRQNFLALNSRGVTLVELMITVSIIGIIAVAAGFSFENWIGGYNIESQIKQIHADLMNARSRAMERNRTHFVVFTSATTYAIYEDTDPGPDGNGTLEAGADTLFPGYPKTLRHGVSWSGVNSGSEIRLDKRGSAAIIKPDNTILSPICGSGIDPAIVITSSMSTVSTEHPDYDCILLSDLRINMGQWNATTSTCAVK